MTTLATITAISQPSGGAFEITAFFLILAAYGGYLMWANQRRGIDQEATIRRAVARDTNPDDITAALDFPRKQARTKQAIGGGRK